MTKTKKNMNIHIRDSLYLSKPGRRPYNEDFVYPNDSIEPDPASTRIFLVCDGVGGAEKGEVASQMVCTEVYNALSEKSDLSNEDICGAIKLAQRGIDRYINENGIEQAIATTMTLLGFVENSAVLVHVGDSRIYHIRNNQILFRTEDHSLVNEMLVQNLITVEEAKNHPQKNVITQAISKSDSDLSPGIHRTSDIQSDDYFFLCTDGVLESVNDDFLLEVLSDKSKSNREKVARIEAKCEESSKDNYSLYLLQILSIE